MTTAYVFPGQGSQFVGMGRELAQAHPVVQGVFRRADETLGFGLSGLCFDGPEEQLGDTLNTQPAIFAHSMAALAAVAQSGEFELPAYVAGHSLGEFSALCAAGALEFEDGLRLVRERGRLMKLAGERQPGGMAAVLGLGVDVLREVCAVASQARQPGVVVANDNCPGQVVLSGGKESVAAALAEAKARGARRAVPLAVSIAAHSPLMASIADDFARAVEATPLRSARVPVVANTTAAPITHPDDIRAELRAQLTSPVRWTESVQWMRAQGAGTFVEIGPKDVLANLVKRIVPEAQTRAIG